MGDLSRTVVTRRVENSDWSVISLELNDVMREDERKNSRPRSDDRDLWADS